VTVTVTCLLRVAGSARWGTSESGQGYMFVEGGKQCKWRYS